MAPEPLFILAPPRSYTSVVGGMLGQHPEAYGLPEVNLSHGDTLGEMWNTVTNAVGFGTSGLLRLLAQLHDGAQTDDTVNRARHWVLRHQHWTGRQVFDHIQEAVGPRMLVEKSPRNTMRIENLRRLHTIFPRANFLHLVRHPRSQGKSALELMSGIGGKLAERRPDPDATWLKCQDNIVEFTRELTTGQSMRIKGETLLREPRLYLAQIADWLGIDGSETAIDAMLHPETSPYASIGPKGAAFGNDPNFLKNPALDFERLARISEGSLEGDLDWRPGEGFSKPVQRLARQFGYA